LADSLMKRRQEAILRLTTRTMMALPERMRALVTWQTITTETPPRMAITSIAVSLLHIATQCAAGALPINNINT
jgi:hypothetical protein